MIGVKIQADDSQSSSVNPDFRQNDSDGVVDPICKTQMQMHDLQIPQVVVRQLFSEFKKDNCQNQLEHLDFLVKHEKKIRNKSAWLVGAIKNNYELPKEIAEEKKMIEDKKIREHRMWLSGQEDRLTKLFCANQLDGAMTLAKNILQKCHSREATETIEKIKLERAR
jgi:hypothetical protein